MMGEWTLFSNHGHVLVCLARNKRARLRDVASDVGITERAVQKIVSELQQAGLIAITKHGRCNQYEIHGKKSLRHPLEAQCTIGRLLQLIVKSAIDEGTDSTPARAAAKPVAKRKPAPAHTHATTDSSTRPAAEVTKPRKPGAEKTTGKAKDSKEEDPRKQGSLF